MASFRPLVIFLFLYFSNNISAQRCRSFQRQSGACVEISRCPPLIQMFISQTPANIRLLQKLTCFEDGQPYVCCPLSYILPASPNATTTTKQPLVDSKNIWWTPPPTTPPPPSQNAVDDVLTRKNIPPLSKCSSGVYADKIIGGTLVEHGVHPWMARIGYKNKYSGEIEYYCAGTVINKRYILTAAHCTKDVDDSIELAEVRLGEHNTKVKQDCNERLQICSEPKDYGIEKSIPHENYIPNAKQNDISLLRVDRDIDFSTQFVQPICLPLWKEYNLNPPEIKNGVVAGWGRTQWNKTEGSEGLMEVTLPIIANDQCETIYRRRVPITAKQLCAGGQKDKDSCGGDSGGPLMTLYPSRDQLFQVGVVSFGPIHCGVGNLPGVYARVDTYLDWILNNMEP